MSSVRERNEPTEAGPGPTARRKEKKILRKRTPKKKQQNNIEVMSRAWVSWMSKKKTSNMLNISIHSWTTISIEWWWKYVQHQYGYVVALFINSILFQRTYEQPLRLHPKEPLPNGLPIWERGGSSIMVRKAGQGELKVGPDLSGGYDPDGVGFVVELNWVYI